MNSYVRLRLQRLTDEAVAAEVAAERFPAGDDLREIEIRLETAVYLADLAMDDPQTVYVVGCAREIEPGGAVGGYIVRAREERVLGRPDERLSLVAVAGVRREEALVRLEHIRDFLSSLPEGMVLAPSEPCLDRPTNVLGRLEAACRIVQQEIEMGTDFLS